MSVIEAPTTTTTVEQEQVRRGSEWLDENHPGWEDKIDLTTLDLKYCSRCILGQLYGLDEDPFRYWDILRENQIEEDELGFSVHGDRDDDGLWPALTEAWRDEITSRR